MSTKDYEFSYMNNEFVNKKNGIHVKYMHPILHVSDVQSNRPEFSYCEECDWCVMLHDLDRKCFIVTPMLEFLNTYEPATNPIDDVLKTFDNILNSAGDETN